MSATRRNNRLYRPMIGDPAEIVSWKNTADGWIPSTVQGVLLEQTKKRIVLKIDGVKFAFDRPQWEHVVA